MLTTETDDVLIGTAGDDTFTAATTTDDATDVIVDVSGADSDVLTWNLTAAPEATRVLNVETINFVTATGTDLTFDLAEISGADNISVVRNDYLNGRLDGTGTIDIVNAIGGLTYTLGAQIDDAEVNFATGGSLGATINAGSDLETLLVTAAGEEGVTITAAFEDVAISLVGNGDTTTAGAGNDAATVSAFGDVALDTASGAGNQVEILTLSGNGAAVDYDITGAIESITLTGDQDITITTSAAEITTETLVNNSTGTVALVLDTAASVSLANAAVIDEVRLAADFSNTTVTVKSGQLVTTAVNQGANPLTIAAAVTTAAAVAVNAASFATIDNEVTTGVTMNDLVFTNYATVSIDASAESITGVDLTASGADITIVGSNDVEFTGTTTADSVDASAVTGDLTLTLAAAAITVTSGTGDDSVTTGAGGVVVVDMGDGADTLVINAVAAGSVFTTGAGVDTVTINGTNLMTLSTEAGNDAITLTDASDISIDGGDGTDTVTVDGSGNLDVTANTNFAMTNVEKVTLADGLAVNNTQFLTFATAELAGTAAKVLTITETGATAAKTIDASGLTIRVGTTSTVSIVGGTKADTITGTDGADAINGGAGADVIVGGLGDDTITVDAAGTGIATAGALSTTAATMDKYYVEAGDLIDITGIVQTQASYDALETIQTSGSIDLTITAGTVEQIKGIYDADADTFTVSNAASANAVMVIAAATDAGTTATDGIILVGVTSLTDLENGVITV